MGTFTVGCTQSFLKCFLIRWLIGWLSNIRTGKVNRVATLSKLLLLYDTLLCRVLNQYNNSYMPKITDISVTSVLTDPNCRNPLLKIYLQPDEVDVFASFVFIEHILYISKKKYGFWYIIIYSFHSTWLQTVARTSTEVGRKIKGFIIPPPLNKFKG